MPGALSIIEPNLPAAPRDISDDERAKVTEILQEFAQFVTARSLFAQQWEEVSQLILPTSRNTFFHQNFNTQGVKKTDMQVDASGGLALHRFCAIADSLVTPKNTKWHGLKNPDPYVMKDRATRLWYEKATNTLFEQRYRPISGFSGQNYNNWQSLGAFGNSTMFVDRFDGRNYHGARGLRYKGVPLGETYYGENHQGKVDRIIRWFRLTAYQAVQKWGLAALPAGLIPALRQNSPVPYSFLHCVKPRSDYDPERIDARGKPFGSYYVSVDGQCLMPDPQSGQFEGGYRVFPYAVSRYDQTPGEVYGRGPAQIVLPGLKTLNAEKKVFLKQGHRAADPVLLIADDGLTDINLRPGAQNKGGMTADGKALIGTLPTGDIQISLEMMQEERGLIDDTFLVSLFKVLSEHPNMTATQVIELVNEKGMLVAPTLGRQHDDYVGQIVEREIDLLAEMGLLDPITPAMREAREHYEVVDTSPLARARRAGEAAGFLRTVTEFRDVAAATGDPSIMDVFDFDVAAPDIARIQGVPESWMSDEQKIAAKRKARANAQVQEQRMKALPGEAAMINANAKAAKAGLGGAPQPMGPG